MIETAKEPKKPHYWSAYAFASISDERLSLGASEGEPPLDPE